MKIILYLCTLMNYGITILHPFQTVEEFQHLVSKKVSKMIKRLLRKSPQLMQGCGMPRVLLGLSVAWGMLGAAKAGCTDAFDHIDDVISPPDTFDCVMIPKGGCIMVSGKPFIEREQVMLHFIWDGFAIFIDDAGLESISQPFFDLADCHQHYAYQVMAEQEKEDLLERKGEKEDLLERKEEKEDLLERKEEKEDLLERKEEKEDLLERKGEKEDLLERKEEKEDLLERKEEQKKEKMLLGSKNKQQQLVLLGQQEMLLTDLPDGGLKGLKKFIADMVDAMLESASMSSIKELQGILEVLNRKWNHQFDDELERLEYLYKKKEYDSSHNMTIYNMKTDNFNNNNKMGDTYHISGDFVKGDKVMGNKYVNSSANTPEHEALKASLEQLLEAVDEDGKALLHAQNQWFGVYRVMVDDYGWRESGFVEFCRRINALGLKPQVACKVDALKKVNQMPPFYKAYAEWEPKGSLAAYNRQKEVVEKFKLLMEENLA